MIFRQDMVDRILSGEKTQTRRPAPPPPAQCRYRVGRTYAVQPGRGLHGVCRIRVVSWLRCRVTPISPRDARAEGFLSPAEFYARWVDLHGSLDGSCYRIEFELV